MTETIEAIKPRLRTEQRSEFDKRLVTLIETEHGEKCSDIPEVDFYKLMDFYDSFQHPELQNPNWDFALKIDYRIYLEWCENTPRTEHLGYSGEGFSDFVTQETHHELMRKGYNWDEEAKQFTGLKTEQYQQAMERVLGGLVLRAIELFGDWGGSSPPFREEEDDKGRINYVYDDERNLRCDLRDYINKVEQLPSQQAV